MAITPTSPCHERWSALTPNGDGRYCQKCDKTVVDLTSLTRRQAEKLVLSAGGSMCGRMRVDPSGAPVFRRETERAPGLLGMAAASLLAACGSTTAEGEGSSTAGTLASVETTEPEITTGGDHLLGEGTARAGGSLASPMMPLADDRDLPTTETSTAPVTTIAAIAIEDGSEDVVPTEDQRLLTEHKEEGREDARPHRSRRVRHTPSTPDVTPATGGRRVNGGHATVSVAPSTTSPGSLNNPPATVYMGGISYTP